MIAALNLIPVREKTAAISQCFFLKRRKLNDDRLLNSCYDSHINRIHGIGKPRFYSGTRHLIHSSQPIKYCVPGLRRSEY